MALFCSWACLRRGPQGPHSLGGTFQCSRDAAEGPEGPVGVGGSFQSPNIDAKGPQGPCLLWGLHLRLVLAPAAPEGPRAHVSCQDSRGMRAGARDARRAPYYYTVGYSGICAGGQAQS